MQQVLERDVITVTKTYTITTEQVRKLEVLAPVLGKKKSEIVRDAIDAYFERVLPDADV